MKALIYILFLLRRAPYLIKTSPLICSANLWTCLYMTKTSVMKEFRKRNNDLLEIYSNKYF